MVIGKGGKDIAERDSMDHVAGYVNINCFRRRARLCSYFFMVGTGH